MLQCRLLESHFHLKPFQASSRSDVGRFSVSPEDMPVTKVFRHDESGLDVSVGVDAFKGTIMKSDPPRIRVAISPGSNIADVFDVVNGSSEAVSVFDNHWRFLSVNRTIAHNDRFYTFTFSCERTLRKRFTVTTTPNKSLDRSHGNPDASGIKRDPAKLLGAPWPGQLRRSASS